MTDFNKLFDSTKIIAILRGVPSEKLINVLDALYDGGIRLAEITYDRTGEVPDSVTAKNIEAAVTHTKGRMLIGAGTVLTEKQVTLTANAGGSFIISPDTNPDIIKATKEAGLVSLPGAMTVSEICTAVRAGADVVKLFPANVFGPDYVKAVLAPLKGVKIAAVSGISPESVPEYLAAGCAGFGIGANIANPRFIKEDRYDLIVSAARSYVEACK